MRVRQTGSHWGVSLVATDEDGTITGVCPSPLDPNPSPLQSQLPSIVRSVLRIDRPYVRTAYLEHGPGDARNSRGRGPFVGVSWDMALGLVATELRRVKETFGNEAIYGGSYGWASAGRLHHAPSLLKRFLGLCGGYVDKLGNHSFGAALGILPHVLGRWDIPRLVVSWPAVVEHSRLVVLFGGAHAKNTQIGSGGIVEHQSGDWFARARAAGVAIVNISPSRSDVAAEAGAEWIAIRPNTDTALMLGLAHTIVASGLEDRGFLARCCEGSERFAAYLLGREDGCPKDADWAGRITGIDPETIRALAQRMARTRTMIATSWSVQRADHGEQPVWMTVVLAALLGQIGLPGGGFSIGFDAAAGMSIPQIGIPKPTITLGPNAVTSHVPVACVADMLLNPGAEIDYDGRKLRFPDIRLVYSIGGNPFHHNTDINRFLRAWQRPETVIVHEPWWGPAAKHADIVLPATTTMERNDILAADGDRYFAAMYKIIEPVAQARNDFDIFAGLAARLGLGSSFDEGRSEMEWLRHLYDSAAGEARQRGFDLPSFDAFWQTGVYAFPQPAEPTVLLEAFRRNPVGNPLKTPSGRIEIYSRTVAAFGYDDCPGHPAWLEPREWLGGSLAKRYPLHLLSHQPVGRLHSQLDPAPLSRMAKISEREPIHIGPAEAGKRDIASGDIVRVFNHRGAFLAGAVVTEGLAAGVVQIATGAWYDPAEPGVPGSLDKHGNPNMVTMSKGTSKLSQSSCAQTVLVEIEKFGPSPPLTAFERPTITAPPDARH
jgi:biotin/methionine sulfoxide reductase